VLVHGLSSSLHEWDQLIPTLVGAGWKTIACDLPGHGNSPRLKDRMGYTSCHLYEIWVYWINGLHLPENFFLVGHSLGGTLCLRYAQQYPERLRGLILIDPLFHLEQLPRPVKACPFLLDIGQHLVHSLPRQLLLTGMKLPFLPTAVLSLAVRQQQAADVQRADPAVTHLIRRLEPVPTQPRKITLPVLVLWGEHDLSLSPSSFPRLVETLPNAQGFPVPGCGHHPHLQKPAEVNRAILDFLKK
jgi:pimeloyl-ACP methyl ester carboxylesterase